MAKKIIKTDPKFRIQRLMEDEHGVLEKLKVKERELRLLLSELEVLRNMLAEVEDELEEGSFENAHLDEEETKTEEQKTEEMRRLENVVQESTQAIEESNANPLYAGLTTDRLAKAASEKTIGRLYELAYSARDWTEEEAEEFFVARDAVFQARNYDLTGTIQQTVDNAYQAVKAVVDKRNDQIQQNYKPVETKTFTPPRVPDAIKTEFKTEYKSPTKVERKDLKDLL